MKKICLSTLSIIIAKASSLIRFKIFYAIMILFSIPLNVFSQEVVTGQLKVINGGSGDNFQSSRIAGFRGSDGAGNGWIEIWSDDSEQAGILLGNPTDLWQGRIHWDDASSHLAFYSGHAHYMTLDGNGFLGLGTSNPNRKLDVNNGQLRIVNGGNGKDFDPGRIAGFRGSDGGGNGWIEIWSDDSEQAGILLGNPTDLWQGRIHWDDASSHLAFYSGHTHHMTLKGNGNLGIGVINPNSKLVVDGKIRSEEVKVEVINGPDYVFESDYQLRTLQETKEYITENKHLPEIPSAKEMEANGIDLGDMNMRLLKKIEELTLYMIEQNKELQSANQKIEQLQKEVSALKKE